MISPKDILKKSRKLKTPLKFILGYMVVFIMLNIMGAETLEIFGTSDGAIFGLYFGDENTLIFAILLLFVYWIFWGFGNDTNEVKQKSKEMGE